VVSRRVGFSFRPDAAPQAQAHQFVAGIEAEQFRIHGAAIANDEAAQHLDLLRFAGSIAFKRDMLGKLFDGLPVIPLFLRFCHDSFHSLPDRLLRDTAITGKLHHDTRLYTMSISMSIAKNLANLPYGCSQNLTAEKADVTVIIAQWFAEPKEMSETSLEPRGE